MKKLFPGMKYMRRITLLALALAALLFPAAAQARSYEVLTVDVPFKFNIASRTFQPGQYQFILAGSGLLALRDGSGHIVASIITRPVETGTPFASSKLVFDNHKNKHKKNSQLKRICLENRSQALEIMGEQLAISPAPFPATIIAPELVMPGMEQPFGGHLSYGFKQ